MKEGVLEEVKNEVVLWNVNVREVGEELEFWEGSEVMGFLKKERGKSFREYVMN